MENGKRQPSGILFSLYHHRRNGSDQDELCNAFLTRRTLQVPVESLVRGPQVKPKDPAITLEDADREHIIKTLEQTRGAIGGPDGAAARLGMKRSTLYFRIRKLGIPTKMSGSNRSASRRHDRRRGSNGQPRRPDFVVGISLLVAVFIWGPSLWRPSVLRPSPVYPLKKSQFAVNNIAQQQSGHPSGCRCLVALEACGGTFRTRKAQEVIGIQPCPRTPPKVNISLAIYQILGQPTQTF
ncbi:MAG: helix-turn-helix domain-containing protein [Terriglobales bacterium]